MGERSDGLFTRADIRNLMNSAATPTYDVLIVGGGIVGLATAKALLEQLPETKLLLLEKEAQLAQHQTGHNSGVIHSGIYYRPGSLKATLCVEGAKLLVEFCQAHQIPYELCGKLVVATTAAELPRLQILYERGLANGVGDLALVGPERIQELEPHARGLRALHVASAGIVDYPAVARALAQIIQRHGGAIRTSTRVRSLLRREGRWIAETPSGALQAHVLITCGGLYADRLAAQAGGLSDLQIVPFRGEYYELRPERRSLVKNMIYPVPDPTLPFLGVHFTRAIDGSVHAGPNAVLALKREGYRKTDVDLADTLQLMGYAGFWRMARRFWSVGFSETYRSWSKRAFVRSLQRLVPEVRASDIVPSGSGVRAQAVDTQGALLDDFNIVQADHAIHVRNVPSPAATSSIRLGQSIAQMAVPFLPSRVGLTKTAEFGTVMPAAP